MTIYLMYNIYIKMWISITNIINMFVYYFWFNWYIFGVIKNL